jgi:hypothetical protein
MLPDPEDPDTLQIHWCNLTIPLRLGNPSFFVPGSLLSVIIQRLSNYLDTPFLPRVTGHRSLATAAKRLCLLP